MKKLSHIFLATLLILVNLFSVFPSNAFASANDFYFKKFNADYYLKKQSDNSSEMNVEETLVAVFPSYNQNHGIERVIPFLNQNDTNLTMESTTSLDISVTRNGVSEPFTIKTYDDRFVVRIGDPNEYVHGENTYVLKYKFIHVITGFDLSSYANEAYQELYWDSNGTGWSQKFDEVSVNLHMDNAIYNNLKTDREISRAANYTTKSLIHENNKTKNKLAAWCYVGVYGANGQNRCEISDIEDGINFNAKNLKSGENLTFVTNFNDGTFVVPKNNYIMELNFKRIDIDYYLSKDEDGHSKMKVIEKFQGLFPTRNITSSFSRNIPYVNNSENTFITKNQEQLGASLKMDGKTIEVYDTNSSPSSGYFDVSSAYTGEYLHGEHEFVLSYDYQDIVEENNNGEQQLTINPLYKFYYDIGQLTVTFHVDKELMDSISELPICDTEKICAYHQDGSNLVFEASDIDGSENIQLSVYFKNGTFVIPEPNKNYVYYHAFFAVIILCGIAFFIVYKKAYRKVGDKIKYLKNQPIVPEYTPLSDLTVGQAAKAYLRRTKNPRVATMLELIVNKKIELKKGKKKFFGGYNWSGEVIDLSNISDEQRDLLKILNGGESLDYVGATFEIENHPYSFSLEDAFINYDKHIKHKLESEKYFEIIKSDSQKQSARTIRAFAMITAFCALFISLPFFIIAQYKEITFFTPFSIYEGEFLGPYIILILLITLFTIPVLSGYISKYHIRTEKALDVTRYLKGLKLYIKMAEKDRLKFLQSVENVDTSEEGIVKLNEKLLPYAALFGLEKSWMKELEKYYELHEESTPDWYATGLSYSVIHSITHTATSRPVDTSSSSSGWSSGGGFSSSSGSSGGGGGGYSGGGGGGGGGGGW